MAYEITDGDCQDYPYIIGYSHYLGSSAYWTWDQLRLAREHNAPRTTTRVWVNRDTNKPEFVDVTAYSTDGLRLLAGEMTGLGLDCSELEAFRIRKENEVDGFYQGDLVRNTFTREEGVITFADPACHKSHVRIGDLVAIWPHTAMEHVRT